jgi:hypothetical protein
MNLGRARGKMLPRNLDACVLMYDTFIGDVRFAIQKEKKEIEDLKRKKY